MGKLIVSFIVNSLALYVADFLIAGIQIADLKVLFIAALVFGIINALLKPILHLVSLPITLLTFGLFALVINAALLASAAWLVDGFTINSFWAAFLGAIVVSVVSTLLHVLSNPKPVF